MNTKYTVSYDDCLDWFLGMKFDCLETDKALKCHVHQEAFILDIVEQYILADCNKSPRATPFRTCFPVDNIAPSTVSSQEQSTLFKGWFVMNTGAPIAWGCVHHKDTAQSSYQVDAKNWYRKTFATMLFKSLTYLAKGISTIYSQTNFMTPLTFCFSMTYS